MLKTAKRTPQSYQHMHMPDKPQRVPRQAQESYFMRNITQQKVEE